MSEEQQLPGLMLVRGLPFPEFGMFKRENIEEAMDLDPEDDDLIIASYPKTGTTWMQYILLQIKSNGEYFPSFDDVTHNIVPYIEMVGLKSLRAQSRPRLYKHHLPYNIVKKNKASKCVYVYRHPEDTVTSFYHFSKSLNIANTAEVDFNTYFENFVTGAIAYGNYFKHVLSFYEHREDENLLMVSYEKLHANRKEGILKISKFLGEEHYRNLLDNDETLNKVIEHTSFDYMKKNLTLTNPHSKTEDGSSENKAGPPKVNFFRKGVVGDGKLHLSAEQCQRLKEAAEKVLTGTSIMDEWYPE